MIIRGYSQRDAPQLEEIHRKFYNDEFSLGELDTGNYLGKFTVIEEDKVICSGGVRTLSEIVLVTDKDVPVRQRREALTRVLQASDFICRTTNHSGLHAFVQDQSWLRQLTNRGFRKTAGTPLVLDIT